MNVLLVAIVLFLGLLSIAVSLSPGTARRRNTFAVLVLFSLTLVIALSWTELRHQSPVDSDAVVAPSGPVGGGGDVVRNRPVEVHSHGYVGSDACRSCHLQEHASWHASWHRTMTQIATPESVIGEFDVSLAWEGRTYELQRRRDQYWVDMELPPRAGTYGRFQRPLVLTTGSHHMQAYWYPMMDDHRFLSLFPFMYLKEDQRWVPRTAVFLIPPGQPQGDETGRWSNDCIRCHATHGRMAIRNLSDPATYDLRDVDTRVAEFGISCEACHGPGEKHVRMKSSSPSGIHPSAHDDTELTIVHPHKIDHKLSAQICGQCHSIFTTHDDDALCEWMQNGWTYRPGDDLSESKLRYVRQCGPHGMVDGGDDAEHFFWSDGMVRVSGREYNGLIESPCFQRGDMSCVHCHQLHRSPDDPRTALDWANDQLGPQMDGNHACTQCHERFSDESVLTQHTHHLIQSSGSNCYNCHMPHTTYGLLKAMRSHEVSSPSVRNSLQTGRPNACNQCHLDRTLEWSARNLAAWYGASVPEMNQDERSIAASILWSLRGDAGQRALMAWSFGWEAARDASESEWMVPYLVELMQDPYTAVRYIAKRSLRQNADYDLTNYDFLAGPDRLRETCRAILQLWQSQAEIIEPKRAAVLLLNAAGHVIREEFRRLLEKRDNRSVILSE